MYTTHISKQVFFRVQTYCTYAPARRRRHSFKLIGFSLRAPIPTRKKRTEPARERESRSQSLPLKTFFARLTHTHTQAHTKMPVWCTYCSRNFQRIASDDTTHAVLCAVHHIWICIIYSYVYVHCMALAQVIALRGFGGILSTISLEINPLKCVVLRSFPYLCTFI